MSQTRKYVKVVVLGDIGRSPRMQYHSQSLAEMGHQVDIIGYGDTEVMDSIKKNPSIFYHYLMPVPQIPIRLLHYVFKTILQTLNLIFLLFFTAPTNILIMQNPPAIPAMLICYFYCKVVKAKFIIDWHNYAHTIMALSAGNNHPLVKVTKKVEAKFGRRANFNFCVTKAMKEDLKNNYGIEAITLYDRPPTTFHPITLKEKHKFLIHCSKKYDPILAGTKENESAFTEEKNDQVTLKSPRPALLISSTSWTEDEDFSLLLSALQDYENCCQNGNLRNLPELICVITGKGPLKKYYLNKISQSHWNFVTVVTPWLEPEDYPLLLASADLGVSLHTSSSGLDLPMKVVDMFGCGLPVCSFNFNCLHELVKDKENSFTFSSSEELSKLILDWFENFPNNERQIQLEAKFKNELKEFQSLRWKENWKSVAAPIFE